MPVIENPGKPDKKQVYSSTQDSFSLGCLCPAIQKQTNHSKWDNHYSNKVKTI